MTFTRKRIDVTISLASGGFDSSGSSTVTLSNHRVSADIANSGGDSMGALQMRLYGLKPDMMNQLTTVGPIASAIRAQNTISIAAGDDSRGMKTVYSGVIDQAWGDYRSSPDFSFNLTAFAGLNAAVTPVAPVSYKDAASVVDIIESLAGVMGLTFENNGVTGQLSNPYFSGSALTQLRECARAADVLFTIDRGVLAIWPKLAFRLGDATVISAATGLVGYPSFTSNGLDLVTEFNPDLRLGGQVQVESSLQIACGIWTVYTVSHSIESERPGGPWFSKIQAVPNVGQ